MASLMVASEYSDRNITSLQDVWMPADLFNLTFSNSTEAVALGAGARNKTSAKSRSSKSKKKKDTATSANSTLAQSGNSPKAEALRSPVSRSVLNENRRALYSVDSWMGNLGESANVQCSQVICFYPGEGISSRQEPCFWMKNRFFQLSCLCRE